ncbi:MAG: hypothetical protein LUH05_02110 [Candidatus Gastranaerophilales bacterium]|nr:hypothetical protein [Candidatus Gastranaerophilales bacterium]
MIKSVSLKDNSVSFYSNQRKNNLMKSSNENSAPMQKNLTDKKPVNAKGETAKKYVDSFVKNAAQSTPVLLGLTAVLSVSDKNAKNIPMKTSLKNNFKQYFIPVLVCSSAVLSVIENKKTKNENKNNK